MLISVFIFIGWMFFPLDFCFLSGLAAGVACGSDNQQVLRSSRVSLLGFGSLQGLWGSGYSLAYGAEGRRSCWGSWEGFKECWQKAGGIRTSGF